MYIVIYRETCIHTYISSMHTAKYTIHKYILFLFNSYKLKMHLNYINL